MIPRHHVPDDLVLAYSAGALGYAEALLVATHLALCPECRELNDRADAVGGALLLDVASAPLPDGLLDRVLARLDEPAPDDPGATPGDGVAARRGAPRPVPAAGVPRGPEPIPLPLRRHTGPLAEVRWRWRAPGLETSDTGLWHRGTPVRLFRLRPGAIPGHGHTGLERGLVLTGGFTDDAGHYTRGDVSIRDGAADHHAVVDEGEPCVMLFVNDGRLLPRSWSFRLASPWVRV